MFKIGGREPIANLFKTEHYSDLAKQASFKPHPVVTVIMFALVYFGVQTISSILIAVSSVLLGIFENNGSAIQIEFTQENAVWNTIVQLYITIIPAICAVLFCCFAERRTLRSMGFVKDKWLIKYLAGMAIGFAAFSAVVGISAAFGGVVYAGTDTFNGLQYALLCVGWLIQGAEEEILLRGYLMPSLSARLPMWAAILISSLFFSLMHIFNSGFSVLAFVNVFLIGIFIALVSLRFNSIFTCCAFHSMWNWAQGNFYGLSVSGIEAGPSVMRFSVVSNNELWTGGVFGLEASLASLIVVIAAIVLLLFIPDKKQCDES